MYIEEPVMENTSNCITWWSSMIERFPLLAKLAFYVLSIPASSAEAERCFSRYLCRQSSLMYSAKRMISKERNQLKHDSAEVIAIVKNWYRHKIFLHEYVYASELFEE